MKKLILIFLIFLLLNSVVFAGTMENIKHTISEKKIINISSPDFEKMQPNHQKNQKITKNLLKEKLSEPVLLIHGYNPQLIQITEKEEKLFYKLFLYFKGKLKTQTLTY